MLADTLGRSPLLAWRAPIRWADACAVVKTYAPSGCYTGAVTCWNAASILYAVEHANRADSVHVRPTQFVSL